MRVWFISPSSEYEEYNDEEPGHPDYQYDTDYEGLFCSALYATEAQAIAERNREFMEHYENERKAHADRLARYKKKIEALELLSLAGINPEDLYPYGIGKSPEFSHPRAYRVGYLEVIE